MIGPGSYKYCATLTFLFSLSKHSLLCPDMVWLSTFLSCLHKLWLNHPVFDKLLPHFCLPLRRPRRLWEEWSQWYLLLFIRCCLRGLGSCFKYLPWNVRCKSSHRVILWYCWPLVVVWWACWVSLLLLCFLRILKTISSLPSHRREDLLVEGCRRTPGCLEAAYQRRRR